MINWGQIKGEYETGKITLAKLAEKYDIPLGTIKSQKSRDSKNGNPWTRDATKKDATKSEKVATIPKEDATKKTAPVLAKEIQIVVETFKEETEQNVELSDVQRFFCLHYVKCLSAIKAYQKAYEASYDNAHSNAYRLMANEGIRAEIKRLKKARAAGIMLDENDVLQKYIDIAFADVGDYVEYGSEDVEIRDAEGKLVLDDDGYPKTYKRSFVHLKNGVDLDNSIVNKVKLGKDGVSVELHDKMRALDMLAKFTDLLDARQLRQLQAEKLKAETELAKITIRKENGEEDNEHEDDGFLEALGNAAATVWEGETDD